MLVTTELLHNGLQFRRLQHVERNKGVKTFCT